MKLKAPEAGSPLRALLSILERQAQGKLDLPRIKYGARRSIAWIRRAFPERARSARGNEVRGSVCRIEEPDVHRVQGIEALR